MITLVNTHVELSIGFRDKHSDVIDMLMGLEPWLWMNIQPKEKLR